ncbi:MAG: outer membrane protein transport protein [Woeseiaceae bacterium]|nr:outer membrane protein transport protein [Woeseiaceae bacterium]
MKGKMRFAAASLLATIALGYSSGAMATNGYFTHGVGTESKGMAGAGIGSNASEGAIMSVSNPALGVFADDRWEVGLALFSPRRSYSAGPTNQPFPGALIDLGNGSFFPSHTLAEGKIDSSSEWFPIPYVAKNWSLQNDANITAAFYGRGGMNTDWDDPNATATSYLCGGNPQNLEPPATGQGPYCAGVAGVDLSQAFLAVNYSAKVNDNFSWGIGPVFALQMFEAKGVSTFGIITETCADGFDPLTQSCGSNPVSLSDNGHEISYGFGFAGGIWWAMSDTVSLGLAYQSKMWMSEFDDYSDLFAEKGGFDIPSSIKGGLSFVASDQLRVNFDIEHTMFGEVDSIANPMANMQPCPTLPFGGTSLANCLGGSAGAGFGWEDMTTYKLGFEWVQNETNTWRFGYSYGEQPIPSADVLFNVLAPGVMEQHITFGLTRRTSNGGVLSFSLMYAPENSVNGPSFFDPGPDFMSPQPIEITMSQFEFEVAYRF